MSKRPFVDISPADISSAGSITSQNVIEEIDRIQGATDMSVEEKNNNLMTFIATSLMTMKSQPNLLEDRTADFISEENNTKYIVPMGTQVLSIQNEIKLGRRIFYLEFRNKLLNTIAELGIPMNYAIQLINCLDRYIPDCCTCCEHTIREWVLKSRIKPYIKS